MDRVHRRYNGREEEILGTDGWNIRRLASKKNKEKKKKLGYFDFWLMNKLYGFIKAVYSSEGNEATTHVNVTTTN